MKTHALTPLILSSALFMTGCGPQGGDETATPGSGEETLCTQSIDSDAYGSLCVLSGTYTADHTLSADQTYLLVGKVFIGDDSSTNTLTIEPGTLILGDTASTAFLAIRRNATIMAEGSADAPIVFTSAADAPKSGDWGGLVLNGNAPINNCAGSDVDLCEAVGEGDTGTYGGNDPEDGSGVLKYVRIQYAGYQISPDNELNGLSLQGVGSDTTLDYIQVYKGKDDGIEFYGGTVSASHLVLIGSGDDSLDWTYGWQGDVQFALIQQHDGEADNGIEADNFDDDNDASPRSEPTLSNLTIIGVPGSDTSDVGILLREGTAGHIDNSIVMGFTEGCVDIDDTATFVNAGAEGTPSGALTLQNTIFFCDIPFVDDGEDDLFDVEAYVMDAANGNSLEDPMLADPYAFSAPDFAPMVDSPALGGFVSPGAGFASVSYRGALSADDNWISGWTFFE